MRALGKWQGVALVDVAGGRRERRTRTPNPPGAGADALSDADCLLPMRAASYRYTFTGEPNKDNTCYEPKPSCFAVVSQFKSSKSCQADIPCGSNTFQPKATDPVWHGKTREDGIRLSATAPGTEPSSLVIRV